MIFPTLGNYAFQRRSREKTGKEMNKKTWCTCKVVFLLIKPIVFLTFSLPSPSLYLKVPIILHLRPDLAVDNFLTITPSSCNQEFFLTAVYLSRELVFD